MQKNFYPSSSDQNIEYLNSELQQLRQINRHLETICKIACLGYWEYDCVSKKVSWSAEVFRITEFTSEAGVPCLSNLSNIIHTNDRALIASLINSIQNPGQNKNHPNSIDIVIQIFPVNSKLPKFINIKANLLHNAAGQLIKLYGTVIDITSCKTFQNELRYRSFFDSLTRLPNRAFFLEHLKLSAERANRDTAYQFAILYLDIDDFKEVNDTLGHAVGDQLLTEVARRLENAIRLGDIVSRIGGDEFAILLEKNSQNEAAIAVASRIQATVTEPFTISSSRLLITVSIGVAFYPPEECKSHSETAVLENADIAMYQAKCEGPNNIKIFQSAMRTERTGQIELKAGLYQALEQDEFVLYYQPLVHFPTQSLTGFETLVRWRHPQRGLLTPMEFLPVVRASHLMPRLESWIFKQACRQLSRWNQQFFLSSTFHLNINISPDFITSASFINKLRSALNETAVVPNQLCIELTEHTFIGRGSKVKNLLQALKNEGIRLALDDFGTGYSSLSYLHRLPIDIIKIDQSFIQSFGQESSLMGITSGIVSLAKQLNLGTAAEGIETSEQLKLVKELGCDYGQGYLFSRAVPATEAERLIANSQIIENQL